jgi:hypothetical protein
VININPRFAETLQKTAGARIAREVNQRLSPTAIKRIQQITQLSDFVGGVLGSDFDAQPQPLLGGYSMQDARSIYAQLNDANLARKNLFFIEVTDGNAPPLAYVSRPPNATPAGSRVGEVVDTARRAINGGIGGLINRGVAAGFGLAGAASGSSATPVGSTLFNLFATSVSYAPSTMMGEKVPFGSATSDRLIGTEATELSLTTMDDEVGTLKRWFDGKFGQAAHTDGTFGVPGDYLVDIAIYHAVAKRDDRAYRFHAKMRPQAIQHELSRSEQAMQELTMTFSQFDSFMTP